MHIWTRTGTMVTSSPAMADLIPSTSTAAVSPHYLRPLIGLTVMSWLGRLVLAPPTAVHKLPKYHYLHRLCHEQKVHRWVGERTQYRTWHAVPMAGGRGWGQRHPSSHSTLPTRPSTNEIVLVQSAFVCESVRVGSLGFRGEVRCHLYVTSRSTRLPGLTQLITPRSNPSARIDIPHPTRRLVDKPRPRTRHLEHLVSPVLDPVF